MNELLMTDEILSHVKTEAVNLLRSAMESDLTQVILYGSCARGDYTDNSDIDIALLVKCDRLEVKKYNNVLAEIATILAMKYFVIVNFVCLPHNEFIAKKKWYGYFKNIAAEGEVLYG